MACFTDRMIRDITEFIFVSGQPEKSDLIFLPGGSFAEPPEHAARLFHQGFAPTLMPSGGFSVKTGRFTGVRSKAEIYDGNYRTECAFFTDVLIRNGVPEGAILREEAAGTTRENSFRSRELAEEKGLRPGSALLVCKSFHARRCLMHYQIAFPGTRLTVCPVDCGGITRGDWHTFAEGIDRVMGELARCGNQFTADLKGMLPGAES